MRSTGPAARGLRFTPAAQHARLAAAMIPALRSILFSLLITAALPAARADIRNPDGAGRGLHVHEVTINAIRGVPVVVDLKATTGSIQAVKFEIAEQPKLGKLEPLVEKWKHAAQVTYTADPRGTGALDEFVYIGKLPDTAAVRAKVTVNILQQAPRIDVHPFIDAGRIVLGTSAAKKFNLHNRGNAPWIAKVPAPARWKWVHPPGGQFQVEAGGRITCEMTCEGAAMGVTDESVTFDGEARVRFTSRTVPPFVVDVMEITLRWNSAEKNRQAVIVLENYSSDPMKVSITAPPWLKLPPVVDLAPDLKLPLTLKVEGQVGDTLRGVLKLTQGKHSAEVRLNAPPGPGVLVMTTTATHGDAFNFGQLTAEQIKTVKHTVTVKNDGGAETTLTVDPLKTFRFETAPPAEIKLDAGAEYSVTILPPMTTTGWPSEELVFNAAGSRLELLLVAGIDAKELPPTAGGEAIRALIRDLKGTGLQKTVTQIAHEALINIRGAEPVSGKEDKSIPRVDLVTIERDDGESITVTWPVPPGGDWNFEVYFPAVHRGPSGLTKIWAPWGEHAKLTMKDGTTTAVLSNIVAGAPVTFSIRTLAPDGRTSYLGKPISVHYRRVEKINTWWPWVAGGAGILIFAGHRAWRYWKKPISASGA
jgi:hypothetical protein